METLSINLTPELLVLVPIVGAILQVVKRIEVVQKVKEWLPFLSIVIALGLTYFTKVPNPVLPSVIIGLVASGGYDLLKAPTIK